MFLSMAVVIEGSCFQSLVTACFDFLQYMSPPCENLRVNTSPFSLSKMRWLYMGLIIWYRLSIGLIKKEWSLFLWVKFTGCWTWDRLSWRSLPNCVQRILHLGTCLIFWQWWMGCSASQCGMNLLSQGTCIIRSKDTPCLKKAIHSLEKGQDCGKMSLGSD